ncbi:MAG: YraN family protein [Alphaproteobacteria bacterium]|nr:YraN family protein [Alphaproteobacteria bacterium]
MSKEARQKRGQKSQQKGLWAERLCCLFLRFKGYHIVAIRAKTPLGEIDLIARRGHVLAFVEVKIRPSLHQALEVISPTQQKRIHRAVQCYLAQNPVFMVMDCRFDAMLVVPWRWPVHVKNAWGYSG